MKYGKWQLLTQGGTSLALMILGITQIFVKSVGLAVALVVLSLCCVIAGAVIRIKVKHDVFDEASSKMDARAMTQTHLFIMFLLIIMEAYYMVDKEPMQNVFPKLILFYAVVNALPSIFYVYQEWKETREVSHIAEE